MKAAKRLEDLPMYVFAAIGKRAEELKRQGVDVIRLDIGDPDLPPPQSVIQKLQEAAEKPYNHGYGGYFGIPQLRQAIASYYERRFGVVLDSNTEVLPLLGAKEGIYHIAFAYLDPGDVALVPNPSYPTYLVGTRLAGGEVFQLPLRSSNNFLPMLSEIPQGILRKTKLLWLNYPNNPTTATASIDFFTETLSFACENGFLVCSDSPYADVCYDGYRAPSILQLSNSKDSAVEFGSLSKLYNMAGWRVGWVVGNREVIATLSRLKSNVDTGAFLPIQLAAAKVLESDQEKWIQGRNEIYCQRRDIVLNACVEAGMEAIMPRATIYVWARINSRVTSIDFTQRLLDETGVSLGPGSAWGSQGEGYVRFSLGIETSRLKEAMGRMVRWVTSQSL